MAGELSAQAYTYPFWCQAARTNGLIPQDLSSSSCEAVGTLSATRSSSRPVQQCSHQGEKKAPAERASTDTIARMRPICLPVEHERLDRSLYDRPPWLALSSVSGVACMLSLLRVLHRSLKGSIQVSAISFIPRAVSHQRTSIPAPAGRSLMSTRQPSRHRQSGSLEAPSRNLISFQPISECSPQDSAQEPAGAACCVGPLVVPRALLLPLGGVRGLGGGRQPPHSRATRAHWTHCSAPTPGRTTRALCATLRLPATHSRHAQQRTQILWQP